MTPRACDPLRSDARAALTGWASVAGRRARAAGRVVGATARFSTTATHRRTRRNRYASISRTPMRGPI
jgi:hypothetical protein